MNQKLWPWVMFLVISTVVPFIEVVIFRRPIDPFSPYSIIDMVLFAGATYWWYVVDKRQRSFVAGGVQNISVIFLSIIGLPVYFVRSRGWLKGISATIV